jgi:hypothetical protein
VPLIHPRAVAKEGPSAFVCGARDQHGGYGRQNSLGLALMRARDKPIADVRARLAGLAPTR